MSSFNRQGHHGTHSIPRDPHYVALQKYFSHPSLISYIFSNPPCGEFLPF
jgi:hypothetical protein